MTLQQEIRMVCLARSRNSSKCNEQIPLPLPGRDYTAASTTDPKANEYSDSLAGTQVARVGFPGAEPPST